MVYQKDFQGFQTGEFLAGSLAQAHGPIRLDLSSSGHVDCVRAQVAPMCLRLHDAPEVLQSIIRAKGQRAGRWPGYLTAELGVADLAPVFAQLPIGQRVQVLDTSQSTSQRTVSILVDGSRVLTLDNTIGWGEYPKRAGWDQSFAKLDPRTWLPAVHEMAVEEVQARGFSINWEESSLIARIYSAGQVSTAAVDGLRAAQARTEVRNGVQCISWVHWSDESGHYSLTAQRIPQQLRGCVEAVGRPDGVSLLRNGVCPRVIPPALWQKAGELFAAAAMAPQDVEAAVQRFEAAFSDGHPAEPEAPCAQ